jgi:ubiquinone/menaquinone biosynthesis C-methylase UbiE
MIQYANVNKQRYQVANVRFIVSDYESMECDEPFDCALFYQSLHHAENERMALETVYRALRDGGSCIVHEPGEGHAEAEWSRNAVERFGVTEKDMPPHHVICLAREVGFRSHSCQPFPERVVTQYIESSEKSRNMNSLPWSKRIGRRWRDRRNLSRFMESQYKDAMRKGGLVVLGK